jgi:hypothetical protein
MKIPSLTESFVTHANGGGTLEQHLRIYQIRHEVDNDQSISVRRKEPTHLIHR